MNIPQRPALDGRRFIGVVIERGKTAGDADIAFESKTESSQYGLLRWHGVVQGAGLDSTLTMVRDGQAAGEKWVLAGEVS
jgi:hypothetical protein